MNFLTWCGYSGNSLFGKVSAVFFIFALFLSGFLTYLLVNKLIKKDRSILKGILSIFSFLVILFLCILLRVRIVELLRLIFGNFADDFDMYTGNYRTLLGSFISEYLFISLWIYILSFCVFTKKILKKSKNKKKSIIVFVVFCILLFIVLFCLYNYIIYIAPNFDSWCGGCSC